MQEIKKILEKRFNGESQRAIASSLHLSRNTVSRIFKAADNSGLTWVQFQSMDIAQISSILFPESKYIPIQVVPDFEYIHKELLKAGTSIRGLWQEYVDQCKDASLPFYHRSRFSEMYQDYVKKNNLTMHIHHKPGDKVMVDWDGVTMNVFDHLTGEQCKAYLFVATLPFSMYTYVQACPNMKQEEWIKCHINMYNYFGGVTRLLVPDNLKTGVIDNRKYQDPTINKVYQEMADHYDTSILPARVRKPKDKAAVEGSVGTITNFIVGRLRNRKFFSFEALNKAIWELLETYNDNPFQKREGSRRSVYIDEESNYMLPLPTEPFELSEWKRPIVQLNYHVNIDHMHYSVPYEYAGKRVDVRSTANIIEVFYKGTRICSHKRLRGKSNQYSTNVDHMPENHQLYQWNGERFEKWAASIGEATHEVVHKLLHKYKVEEQAYKGCLALLKLSDRYTSTRLENACRLALDHISQPSYKNIKLILESGQDLLRNKGNERTAAGDSSHAFVRGKEYYGGKLK
ncbi:MAG: IS21 family transposase [Erysipelotrichaceae bacterium]|nr:IS21 family transposase [Erysipelotrichaceae bacterium]